MSNRDHLGIETPEANLWEFAVASKKDYGVRRRDRGCNRVAVCAWQETGELPGLNESREVFVLCAVRNHLFLLGCAVELSLLFAGAMLAFWLGQPLFGDLRWSLRDVSLGIVASVPLLALFFWLLRSSLPALKRIGEFLEVHVRPAFHPWAIWQLAVISLLAGVCEEVFFRGVLHGGLARHIGTIPALAVSSVVFGLFHLVTKTYALIATLIGAYLGVLWLVAGNLLAPIIAHAVYDLVALIYFLRGMSARTGRRKRSRVCDLIRATCKYRTNPLPLMVRDEGEREGKVGAALR